jgi:predicted acyl esterase
VAGSNFPRFGRNSHTGGPVDDEPAEAHRPATISIRHDTDHPSQLSLPQINP